MSNNTVYLEDIAGPQVTLIVNKDAAAATGTKVATNAKPANKSNAASAKAGDKRQRKLFEVGATKRIKLDGANAPKKLNAIPFSLTTYFNSLASDEERGLLKLERETLSPVWFKMLQDELKKKYFLDLKRFLFEQGVKDVDDPNPTAGLKVFPAADNIYSWSRFTPLGRVRVVIIGQDPYHGFGQAHGLCFSVQRGISIPPSLQNIYKEVKAEYPEFVIPKHGNLEEWAKQGVLLLNTCLTVRPHEANSHSGRGWEKFTQAVLNVLEKWGGANLPGPDGVATGFGRGIVFMAWGSPAQKCVENVNTTKHLVLKSAHPSPLSANRGFFGNGHFLEANRWLEQLYGPDGPIDWCKLEPTSTAPTTAPVASTVTA